MPITYLVRPKYDGLTVDVCYVNGQLTSANTADRDISEYAKSISDIPNYLSGNLIPSEIVVRGEIVVLKNRYNPLIGPSSILDMMSSIRANTKPDDRFGYMCHTIVEMSIDVSTPSTEADGISFLSGLGFRQLDYVSIIDGLNGTYDCAYQIMSGKHNLEYRISGIVVKPN